MAEEQVRLICGAVGDPWVNVVPGSERGHYCDICAAELWMSPLMQRAKAENPRAIPICAECSAGLVDDDTEIRAVPGDPYAHMVKDIARGIKRRYGRDEGH